MKSFNHFLREQGVSNELRSLLYHISRSIKYINFNLRSGNTGVIKNINIQGEQQMELDRIANSIILDELEKSELVTSIISEEEEFIRTCKSTRGDFTVAFDPLDGSSLIDTNCSIGAIFGIWDVPNIIGLPANKSQVAACYAVFGPRITFVITVKGLGTHEFELNDVGEFTLTQKNIIIEPKTKYFAPGNLRGCSSDEKYYTLIQNYIFAKKTLRYSGGMVPDLNHILCKKEGIFLYPGCKKHPNGKLRLIFECMPFALIFEESQGVALNRDKKRILDLKAGEIHERSTIFIGSKDAVDEALNILHE